MLEKESEDFASRVFPSGFFVVHDASWGGEHKVSGDTKHARQPTKQQKHRRRVQGTMRQGTVTGHSQQVGVMWRWWNPVLIEVHFYLNTHRPPRLSVYVITSQRCYLLTTTWVGNHKSIWPLHPGFVKRTIWFLCLKAFRLLKCGNVNALTGENTTTKNHRNQVVTQYTLMCTTTNGPSPISLQWLYDDAKGKITIKDEDCGLPSKTAFCHFVQCWNIVQLRLTRNFKHIA